MGGQPLPFLYLPPPPRGGPYVYTHAPPDPDMALGMDIVDSFEGFEVGGEAFDFS